MESQNHILEYLDLFKKNIRIHNRVALFGFLYLLVNLLFITEPNFQRNKKGILISINISSLQSQIAKEKKDSIQLELKTQLESKKEAKSSLTTEIKKAKDLESILIIFAFLNAEWEHASLYLSFLILLFVIYLAVRRVKLLRIFSKYLRVSFEKYGPNESREFGIDSSFLLAPVPKAGFKFLNRKDVIESLGWKQNHKTMSVIIGVSLIGFFLVQIRLLFQEYFIAQSVITFHTFTASILTVSTAMLFYIWFRGNFLFDSYNSDNETIAFLSRRDFLRMGGISGVLLVFPVSYKLVEGIRKKVDRLIAIKPRFKIRRGKTVTSKLARVEETASALVKENQSRKASVYLFSEINAVVTDERIINHNSQHIFRLIDFLHKILLVQIHRVYSEPSKDMKEDLEEIVSVIEPDNFRLSLWNSDSYKWEQVVKDKKNIIKWNKIEIN